MKKSSSISLIAFGVASLLAISVYSLTNGGDDRAAPAIGKPQSPVEGRLPPRVKAQINWKKLDQVTRKGEISPWRMATVIDVYLQLGDKGPVRQFLAELKPAVGRGEGLDLLYTLLEYYPRWSLTRDELDRYFESLPKISDPKFLKVYRGWQNQVALRKTPLEFSALTLEGKPFDVSSLRGKIVLLDHWYPGCSACEEAMPVINKSYLKHKDRGFTVVSVIYDDPYGKFDLDHVKRIEKRTGVKWLSLNASGRWKQISDTYGYSGAPQYMLLDREGRMIAGTGEVDLGRNLEALLEKHL
jgi:hypothetical protein